VDFWGIGFGEVLVILVIALIVLGPARVTEFGKMLGKMVRSLKQATSALTSQITKEMEEQEKKRPPQ
jgi:sec-independent protein translocase protein TatA